MKRNARKSRTLGVRVSPWIHSHLLMVARRKQKTLSDVIRFILETHFEA